MLFRSQDDINFNKKYFANGFPLFDTFLQILHSSGVNQNNLNFRDNTRNIYNNDNPSIQSPLLPGKYPESISD
jgi:hypothetical protein